MRPVLMVLVAFASVPLVGCSSMKQAYRHQEQAQKEFHDDWKIVGDEGRGELPREKETDALTPLLESPQARAINRNLGYD